MKPTFKASSLLDISPDATTPNQNLMDTKQNTLETIKVLCKVVQI